LGPRRPWSPSSRDPGGILSCRPFYPDRIL
jgi:hypothetical protein